MELFKLFGTIAIQNSDANEQIDDTTDKAERSEGKITSAFKKIGAAVATYFAIDKIKDFGIGCINASADAEAASSQFTQVFGELEKDASKSLNKISKSAGINKNRMKGSFTQIAAFAKTTGMSTEDSLALTERAMVAVADSAAFYDRSLEDTTESLQSFLKGNYENDAALGLSCTETTRNAAANELYGKSFNDLSEAQKQLTLLQMVEDANKASGALGQAARESDTWTNQTGNLKQAWTDFQATIGSNILPTAVGVVKSMVKAVQNLTKNVPKAVEKFKGFISKAKEVGGYVAGKLKPAFDDMKNAFNTVKDALQPVIDVVMNYITQGELANDITELIKTSADLLATGFSKLSGFVKDVVKGFQDAVSWGKEHQTALEMIAIATGTLTTAIVAYNAAQAIKKAGGIAEIAQLGILQVQLWALTAAETVSTIATTAFGAAMAFLTSPITIVVAVIGALIAIGVLLYKNWDTVKAKCVELWGSVKEKFEGIKETVSKAVDKIKEWVNGMVLKIPEIAKDALENAKTAAKTAKEKIVGWINRAKGKIPEQVKTALENAKTAAKTAKEKIIDWIGKAKGTIPEQVKTALDNAKNYAQRAKEKIIEWIGKAKGTVPSQVLDAFDRAKTAAQRAKEKIIEWIGKAKGVLPSIDCGVLEAAKTAVSNAIQTLKGFFNFNWSLPKIPMPHFSISGGFSLKPPSVPKFSVSWYKKAMDEGMIMNQPTIFGYNAKTNQFMAGGEAGSETVVGTDSLMNMIQKAVSAENTTLIRKFEILISMLSKYFPEILEAMNREIVLDTGVVAGELAPKIDSELGKITSHKGRGN